MVSNTSPLNTEAKKYLRTPTTNVYFRTKTREISQMTRDENNYVCVCVLPGWEGGVIDKAEQLLRVTNRNEALHGQLKPQGLILW